MEGKRGGNRGGRSLQELMAAQNTKESDRKGDAGLDGAMAKLGLENGPRRGRGAARSAGVDNSSLPPPGFRRQDIGRNVLSEDENVAEEETRGHGVNTINRGGKGSRNGGVSCSGTEGWTNEETEHPTVKSKGDEKEWSPETSAKCGALVKGRGSVKYRTGVD